MSADVVLDSDVELLAPEEEMVPEHDLHRVLVDLIAAGLVARFADRDDVAVFARLGWFPDRDDTRIRLDPDVMVVRGRPPGHRKSYRSWQEGHVPPAVLIEVWSDDDTDADYRRRLERAHQYGVQEVVIVDPFAPGGVRVEHLVAETDRFRSVASSTGPDRPVVLDSLGISMAGGDELAVIEEGRRWPTTADAFRLARSEAERADRETARAEQEAARAEQEAARAQQERRRADALAERLRQAGIDPPDDGRGVEAPNP
ncbi:MAG TPA: Uma2 family endonuclease [Egibacteraceae bacterium]|nr:Uma2 family endonuclease [Egibacteraceae bacterium]